MDKVDLTYGGKLKTFINVLEDKELDINYTIDGETGEVTTTSLKLNDKPLMMITFNYQDLKKIVEGENNK